MGVDNHGIVKGGHLLKDYEPDNSELSGALSTHLELVPPFSACESHGFVEITIAGGVTIPTFLKADLVGTGDQRCRAGTVFVRQTNGKVLSSAPATKRIDWQKALHLWETNRGITIQGQIVVQFCLIVNEWNPFRHSGYGNTDSTKHRCWCLADVADTLGRPKLRSGLCAIVEKMKEIPEPADFGPIQNKKGGEFKQYIVKDIKHLCVELDLIPPQ